MKPIHVKPSLYAYYFEDLKVIALKYGYNLVLHGSMNRDLDLIAIPWVEKVKPHGTMIKEFAKKLGGTLQLNQKLVNDEVVSKEYSDKPHSRMCYTINILRHAKNKVTNSGRMYKGYEFKDEQYYLDISVMPKL